MEERTHRNRTFVLGDIHGAYRALRQCLERSGFNNDSDRLIALGDVCDGWPETREAIDELLHIKHLNFIMGNHDLMALEWMKDGSEFEGWLRQGGQETIDSYRGTGVPASHIRFISNGLPYLLEDNRLFVHAGIKFYKPLEYQDRETFLWDRELVRTALYDRSQNGGEKLTSFDEIYVGHTVMPGNRPVKACEVWMMDTGAGWSGVLSMMDIDTKDVFTSDPVPSLYPGIQGRQKFRR